MPVITLRIPLGDSPLPPEGKPDRQGLHPHGAPSPAEEDLQVPGGTGRTLWHPALFRGRCEARIAE